MHGSGILRQNTRKGGVRHGCSHTLSHHGGVLCRQQGYFDLTTIQTAIFEYNGKLTILPVTTQRPVTPQDLDLNPDQELIFTELIMDGRILEDNLHRMGLDRTWLDKQLKQRHISSAKEVFLAVCDRNLKFVLFKK